MSDRKKVLASSVGILLLACLVVAAVSIWLLYETAFNQERNRLIDLVKSQARLIESIAKAGKELPPLDLQESQSAALRQVGDAYSRHVMFGETGELLIARREGDAVVFLLRHLGATTDMPEPVSMSNRAAEPMRRALTGQSGWMIGEDYREVTVLAAYEPIEGLGLGIVAKTDLSEVRTPFLRSGGYVAAISLMVALAGSLLYLFSATPLIGRIEESKDLLRLVIDSVPALISYIGSDYTYRFTNKAYQEWFGHTGATGRPMRDVLGEEALETLKPYLERALSGERVTYEHLVAYKSGGSRFIEGNYVPHVSRDGRVEGFVALVNDLTERRRMEEQLRVSEERFRSAFSNAAIGFAMTTPEGGFVDANPAYCQITGYSMEELRTLEFSRLVHPDDTPRNVELNQRMIEGEMPAFVLENRYLRKDGAAVWVRKSVSLVRKADGTPQWIIALVEDVTERTRMQRAQERRLAAMNALIQVGADAIASESMQEMLDKVVDAARQLTGAKIGTSGHGYTAGQFQVGATSSSADSPPCPPGSLFIVERGGVFLDLIDRADSVRLTHKELSSHPRWWGLPEGHTPLQGLLGARLSGRDGAARGLIMVSQKEEGDFTREDELLLQQLASITSIGLQHLEAREELEQAYGELEQRVRDRTVELTRANEELDRQREVLQTIVDNIPVMLCFYDPQGRVQLVSRELERLLGWSFEQMRREEFDIMAAVYPDPEYRRVVWAYMMEAAPGWRDVRMTNRSGAIVESSWANVRLSDGSQIGIGLDISARVQAERALRQSEERFRLITDTIQDVFWMSTPGAGRMLYVSPAYERIWGRSRESLYADPRSFIEAVHPEDRALVRSQLEEHARGTWECQYRIVQPDGSVRWINDRGFPIRDAQGSLLFMTGVATDISERKGTEEELALYMRKLQESNRDLQDFASIASHDLQEPLRKVSSFGNMLKLKYGRAIGEEGQDYLHRMLNATERMQSLLKALLDYSRVSSRAEPFQQVDLALIVRDVVSDLEVRIVSTGGEVQVGELPTVEADPTQMRQLFQNLIGNALKFHREGERPIVRVHCSDGLPACREVLVEDNGIGFDEKYLERIFAPFQRLHGRSSYEGTGMGLAICKKIVERHGGSITGRSTPGGGSVFAVRFAETKQ